ncbi:MAG TPA: phage holin family protein [Dehalococcoidia bacterium]|nr:phage holin family protein [Dehalococcoidia bacterium]
MRRFTFDRYLENTEPEWERGDVPWIVRILVRWGIIALGFLAAKAVVNSLWDPPDRMVIDGWGALVAATGIFLVVRAILRPILMFLTCPLQLITLGLFVFVVNALILLFTREVCDWFNVDFTVDSFFPAFVAALVISAVTFALDRIVRRNMFGPRWA